MEQLEDPGGVALVLVLPGQGGEAEEAECGRRVARRDRVVVDVLASDDELLVVVRGGEEAAALRVGEELDHLVRGLARGVEPADVEGRLIEREEGLGQVRVVLEVSGQVGAPVLVRAKEPAAVVPQVPPNELGARNCGVEVLVAGNRGTGLRQGADHERVPRAQPLVVLSGPRPP